ncbi:MAG TPA: CarD family transcriptional regulator, partial [Sulfuricaulis sp.]|nr:CarD family transcriptional regulator [Sulfuricaulis sp.]
MTGSGRGLAIASAAKTHKGPMLIITASSFSAERLEDEIRFYNPELPILPFPDWESLPYDVFSPHQDIVSQRLETLHRLPEMSRGVMLASITTLLHRLPPRDYVHAHSFLLQVGDKLEIQRLREQLVRANYHSVSQVMEAGEFAVRGGIVDVFPTGSNQPYRLDLFGDLVESIREFGVATQRSGNTINAIRLLPAREYPLTEESIQHFRQAFRARFEGDPQKVPLYRDITKGITPSGAEYYLPLFFSGMATIFDYLPVTTLCLAETGVVETAARFKRETEERYREMSHDRERPLLPPAELFLDSDSFFARLRSLPSIEILEPDTPSVLPSEDETAIATVCFGTRAPANLPVDHKSSSPYAGLFDYLKRYRGRLLIVAESAGRRETLKGLLREHGQPPVEVTGWREFLEGNNRLTLTVADLEKGLLLSDPDIAVITEAQLYGERAAQRRRRRRAEREPEAIIRSLAELKIGDPVVHEDHGVGRYLGLQTLDIGDGPGEFLSLEYADGDKLYIPVLALHLISRYTGTDPDKAPLHKLGGEAWEKAKRRALEKAHDAAAELLEIYALRA